MLDTLITSKTRIKLLMKFFLNSNSSAYLRSLENEFGESSNAIRMELNRFEQANLLASNTQGNRKYYMANKKHPLFGDIHNLVMKHIGIDQVIDKVVNKLGAVDEVYLVGDFARGCDGPVIDLIFSGVALDKMYLMRLVEKCEQLIDRHIRYMVFDQHTIKDFLKDYKPEEILLLFKQQQTEILHHTAS